MSRKLLVATALLCVGGLTACSGAQPGVAARVGDKTISTHRVNDLTESYCQAISRQLKGEGTVQSMSALSARVVDSQVMRAIAEQVAEQYDVAAGTAYRQSRASLTQGTSVLDPEVAEAVIEIESGYDYVNDIASAAAQKALEADGVEDSTVEAQTARAKDIFSTWISKHRPEINPVYGLELTGLSPQQSDTGTSFALSDHAVKANAEDPGQDYLKSLPESQRCG